MLSAGAVSLAVVLLTALTYWSGTPSIQDTVTQAFISAVMVIGLGIFVGNTGYLSFGHVAFAGVAAYGSALLTLPPNVQALILPHLPQFIAAQEFGFPVASLLTVVVVALVGLIVGVPIVRLPNAAATIATLGLLIVVNSVLIGASDFTRGSQAIYGVPKAVNVWVAGVAVIGAFCLARWFRATQWGLFARAVREDEVAAASVGVLVFRARLIAWAASIPLTALGGALFAHHVTVFSPKVFHFETTFGQIAMLIIGGSGSATGALLGTAIVTLVVEALRRVEEARSLFGLSLPQLFGLTEVGLSVVILLILYTRGKGVMGNTELDEFVSLTAQATPESSAQSDTEQSTTTVKTDGRLVVRDLTKRYGGVTALTGVSFELSPGEILGLIGPNGSGKSTLLGCIAATQPCDRGSVEIDANNVTGLSCDSLSKAGLARTFQTVRLFNALSAMENVEVALLAHGRPRAVASTLLAEVGLGHLADRPASSLAYGQQRRLEIARALATAPKYLLLDEPAAGMPEDETGDLIALLQKLKRTRGIGILIVEHDLHLIMRACDRVLVLDKGTLIANERPQVIRNDPAVIAAYFGERRTAAVAAPGS